MDELIPIQLAGYVPIFVLESYAILVALVAAFLLPRALDAPCLRLEALIMRIAQRPVLSLALAVLAPMVFRAALHPLLHLPQPWIHDEFGNLLAADTFARGRLANPPHPLWVFFESMHILQQPTYASKYPPAQGLFLAAGQLLTGLPFAGVVLSMGLLCAALLWMLRGWLPPGWALLGAGLAAIRIGLFSYWGNSYWGGAPAAIGGALVAGSVPRIFRLQRPKDSILLGAGLVLLAASRPFEGLCFSIPFGVAALVWTIRGSGLRSKLTRVVCPLGVTILLGGVALAYDNWRVTSDPFEFPEMLERKQYAIVGNMLWDNPRPAPDYHHAVMRDFHVYLEPSFTAIPHSARELVGVLWHKALVLFDFYLGPVFAFALLAGAAGITKKPVRLLLLAIVATGVALACERWRSSPHYFAPATGAIYALLLCAMRGLWTWQRRDHPTGRFLVRGIVAVVLAMAMVRIFAGPLGLELTDSPSNWSAAAPGNFDRASVGAALNRMPGRFLVIVRYKPLHPPVQEWVYNAADIDAAKIVWAHDMGARNQLLLKYFQDRRVLLIEPDVDPMTAHEYPLSP